MALRARHYGCGSFRAIREAFGISPEVYARAFPNNLSEHDPGWRQRLKESVSEGASGSFFYHVRSNTGGNITSHFIVKQISPKEKRTLMRFLHRYQNHVVEQRGRSLIQYFGCHSMSLRWRFSGKVYFVVMRNFLPVQQWLVFDLKGATANRRALATNLLHQMHAGADPRGGAAYGTLRDWEWMDIAMVVDVSREDKASLAEMIDKDAAFLASQGLLDYSLLIGIHRLPSDLPPQQRECRVRELKASGGYLSLDRQKVYFFGIIDVLERYNSRWRVQHACLTVGYWLALKGEHADGISAMPPHEYADRFRTFVQKEVLQYEPAASAAPQEGSDRPQPAASPLRPFQRACCAFRRVYDAVQQGERWMRLWARRRRGLVRERIEADRADHIRRIQELEQELRGR